MATPARRFRHRGATKEKKQHNKPLPVSSHLSTKIIGFGPYKQVFYLPEYFFSSILLECKFCALQLPENFTATSRLLCMMNLDIFLRKQKGCLATPAPL
jgi:hypothetical protein